MQTFSDILVVADHFVWGPAMLILLVGTGIFLTIRTKALCWRNLLYALRSVMSKEARQKNGTGDVSPFSALTTALAATIGTGNIVGVATAMVSGGPGALVWMWISAAFGMTSKFGECMLSIKYRETNEIGQMSGGPMYTMKKAFRNKKLGSILGWLFALFAVFASFGIGNLTQANSISLALHSTFRIPVGTTGIIITILTLFIILGGIQSISKVSQMIVPLMAVFYAAAGVIIILGNLSSLPSGIAMIFKMAFSIEAVGGGLCGGLVASMAQAIRFGVARGVFSNEAGMGSAAITAAAASTDDCVRQGYINMTGTFWDTIVVCTITGLCIASSGVLGSTDIAATGSYICEDAGETVTMTLHGSEGTTVASYNINLVALPDGKWVDESGNEYIFGADGSLEFRQPVTGSALTIRAFETVLGKPGGWLVCIGIALFAFSTILGWEYHGEKAFEYLLGTHRFNMLYRIVFALLVYLGATTTLEIAWNFSDIANALMALPNLICLLALSGVIADEMNRYQKIIKAENSARKASK